MQEKAHSIEGAATSLKTKTSPFYLNTLEFVLCATVAVAHFTIFYIVTVQLRQSHKVQTRPW